MMALEAATQRNETSRGSGGFTSEAVSVVVTYRKGQPFKVKIFGNGEMAKKARLGENPFSIDIKQLLVRYPHFQFLHFAVPK